MCKNIKNRINDNKKSIDDFKGLLPKLREMENEIKSIKASIESLNTSLSELCKTKKECIKLSVIEKPKAPIKNVWWIGILMAFVFIVGVAIVLIWLGLNDKLKDCLGVISIALSIAALLFAIIFCFIYKYHLNSSDALMEDYLKDKDLWRKIEHEKAEKNSDSIINKSEFNGIKATISNINSVVNEINKKTTTVDLTDIKTTINSIGTDVNQINTKTITVDFTVINQRLGSMQESLDKINKNFEEKPTGNYAKLVREFLEEGKSMIKSFRDMESEFKK